LSWRWAHDAARGSVSASGPPADPRTVAAAADGDDGIIPPKTRHNEIDMLTDSFPFLLPRHIERGLASRLRSLADDLERIRSGEAPTSAELERAPLIKNWRPVLTPLGLRLTGFVYNHPLFGTRPTIISQLWAADADGRWVRTLSRLYRLGRSAEPKSMVKGARDGGHDDV
jgi:hypothetical protein